MNRGVIVGALPKSEQSSLVTTLEVSRSDMGLVTTLMVLRLRSDTGLVTNLIVLRQRSDGSLVTTLMDPKEVFRSEEFKFKA